MISRELNEELCAVALGYQLDLLASQLGQCGADKAYLIDNQALGEYSPETYVEALSLVIRDMMPKLVIFGATSFGNDLAPRLAARYETGLVSNCISLKLGKDRVLHKTKRTNDGRIISTFICVGDDPQMATVDPDILDTGKVTPPGDQPEVPISKITGETRISKRITKIIGVVRADPESIGLEEFEVIVAGGRGVGGTANFHILEELAKLLGGCVAGSRGAVDAGWIPPEKLIGLTGAMVAPRLYIACGISGELHHTLGMKNSRYVVAINTDKNAPIFKIADLCIVGDLHDIVPRIMEKLREVFS